MEKKIKSGTTPTGIVSIVFSILGGIYFVLGLLMLSMPTDNEDREAGLVFTILGAVFLITALILSIFTIIQRKRLQAIYDSGKYILGEITDIITNYYVRVNSRNPYIILVRYIDRYGKIHIFRSTNQKLYPDRSIIGKQVKVYYENENFKHYYVDLEGVLPQVIEH